MVDAVYRGNVEELLSVLNHLKKYIIVFVIVLLVLISIFHYSKYSVQVVPLITVILVLLPAVYYTTVLVLKFGASVMGSNQPGEVTTRMSSNNNRQALKTPELPYPKSPTPPPSYEEATKNDNYQYQPQPWLPSTSSGFSRTMPPQPTVFNVEYQYNAAVSNADNITPPVAVDVITTPSSQNHTNGNCLAESTPPITKVTVQNIPSVTITMDNTDRHSMEI